MASPVDPINTSNIPVLAGNSQAAQVGLSQIFVQCIWPSLFKGFINKSITQLSAKSGGIPPHGSVLRKYKYTISKVGQRVSTNSSHPSSHELWKTGITGWFGLEWTLKPSSSTCRDTFHYSRLLHVPPSLANSA